MPLTWWSACHGTAGNTCRVVVPAGADVEGRDVESCFATRVCRLVSRALNTQKRADEAIRRKLDAVADGLAHTRRARRDG
jgi:hypothetical protein